MTTVFMAFDQEQWENFIEATQNKDPRDVFVFGLQKVSDELPKVAIDVGFGAGNETVALLELGWEVTAIDLEQKAARILKNKVNDHPKLKIITKAFQDVRYHPSSFIHAGFSLPFCHPDYFETVWKRINNAVIPRGIFCGQLFGPKDAWSDDPTMSFHTRKEIHKLLERFEILKLEEIEGDRPNVLGGDKYWHYYNIIAKKVTT